MPQEKVLKTLRGISRIVNLWDYLFTFLLLVVIVLAVVGIGWETFSVGVINGFDKVIDVGTPLVKDLTYEARDIVNDRPFLR